jgi:hypothetical protein
MLLIGTGLVAFGGMLRPSKSANSEFAGLRPARHTIFGGNVQGVATGAGQPEGFARNGESILSIFCHLVVVRGGQRMERGLRSRVLVGEGR